MVGVPFEGRDPKPNATGPSEVNDAMITAQ